MLKNLNERESLMKNLIKLVIFALFISPAAKPLTPEQVVKWFTDQCDIISPKEFDHMIASDTTESKPVDASPEPQPKQKKESKKTKNETYNFTVNQNGINYECKYSTKKGAEITFYGETKPEDALSHLINRTIDQYRNYQNMLREKDAPKKELTPKTKKQFGDPFFNDFFDSTFDEFSNVMARMEEDMKHSMKQTTSRWISQSSKNPFACFSHKGLAYTIENCQACIDGLTTLYETKSKEWTKPQT